MRAISEVIMEALMRLNATRAGHDKLVRSAQYACRFTNRYAENALIEMTQAGCSIKTQFSSSSTPARNHPFIC